MNETLQTALRKLRLSGLASSLDVRLQLVVIYLDGKKHLPIIRLKRVA